MSQAGPGKIRLFDDFCGPEIPVGIQVAHTAAAGYFLGPFAIKGDTDTNDAGAVALGITSGAVRLTTTNEDTKGCGLTTDLVFSPVLNGPIIVEARVQMQVLTAREIFVGICGTMADDLMCPLTYSAATTVVNTASHFAGFFLSSELTAAGYWHNVYNGGTTTGPTSTLTTDSGVLAVATEWDVLRLEVDPNGTARYFINGELEDTITTAVSTTTLQGVICGPFGNASTITDLDVDYLLVNANRDWTR